MFELKPLSKNSVPAAIEKALHYRQLNEPLEAECICLDVLEIEPTNQEVLVILILALSDQFARKAGEKYGDSWGAEHGGLNPLRACLL